MIRSKAVAEALYLLNERAIKYIDVPTLKDALLLFQQQGVITMEMKQSNQIEATVRDNQVYNAKLNINLLGNSQCSCKKRETCIHLIAVYFAAYAFQGFRPEIIVKKVIERAEQPQALEAPAAKAISLPSIAAQATKPQADIKPSPITNNTIQSDDNITIWHSYFHAKFKQFPSSSGFVDFKTVINSMTKKFSALCENWPAHQQHFFKMHICLFQLQKLEEHALAPNNRSSYYYSYGYKDTLDDCGDQLVQHLKNIKAANPSKLNVQQLEQTADLLSVIAFPAERSSLEWNDYYCLIWNLVLMGPLLSEAELNRLHRYLKQTNLTTNQQAQAHLALAYAWFMERNDVKATKSMEQSGLKQTLKLNLHFLISLESIEETTRLIYWLNWLKPHMIDALEHELEHYLDFWSQLVPQHISEDALIETIADFLPRSSTYYMERLFELENYEQLLDYMLTQQLPLSYLPVGLIRKIDSKQSSLLLPHYHHTVEIAILQKNRDSYKLAVKALKKLQLIYKKLKQTEHWDRYINWIKSNYSRLSALQEEITKGIK